MDSLKRNLEDPTVDDLLEIFLVFPKGSIKRYLFKSRRKNLNLELTLSIVQNLISNESSRAKSIELKVMKFSNKGKKKVIVKDVFQTSDENPISAADFHLIDETIFRLTDASDKSHEKVIAIGRGHKVPSDNTRIKEGYLTPSKQTRESFKKAIEVRVLIIPTQTLCHRLVVEISRT